jgi:hypothetical protein
MTRIALLVLMSVLSALLLAEGLLRLLGYGAWTPVNNFDTAPVVTEPDSELGWRNKPGRYAYSVTGDGDNRITLTLAADGTRGIGADATATARPEIWLFGGSFTQGWGVTDQEAFSERLAAKFDTVEFRNFAVPGYGTLQSYLSYRSQLKEQKAVPLLVIYGFTDFHLERNVATKGWLYLLDRAASRQAWVRSPYARLTSDGYLLLHAPRGYTRWPLSDHSALVTLVQQTWIELSDQRLRSQMDQVNLAILREWNALVRESGSKFVVVLLYAPEAGAGLRQRLGQEQIECVDIADTPYPQDGTRVLRDGHPNGQIHGLWAERLGDYIESKLSGRNLP